MAGGVSPISPALTVPYDTKPVAVLDPVLNNSYGALKTTTVSRTPTFSGKTEPGVDGQATDQPAVVVAPTVKQSHVGNGEDHDGCQEGEGGGSQGVIGTDDVKGDGGGDGQGHGLKENLADEDPGERPRRAGQ